MVALERPVDHSKAVAVVSMDERLADGTVAMLGAQMANIATDFQDHVDRVS